METVFPLINEGTHNYIREEGVKTWTSGVIQTMGSKSVSAIYEFCDRRHVV